MSQDRELVLQFLAGEEAAFAALYEKYKRSLFRTALAITEDQGAAEEILQDCFLRAYSRLSKLDLSQPLGPWLHRIVVNLSYTWAGKRRFWPLSLEEVVDWLVAGPHASPEQALEEREIKRRVEEALRSLNLSQRLVVILFYLQGFTLGEIAYILNCPLGTVKSRLYHARRILRDKLGPALAPLRESM
ncbi:MAG: sigma-70 family RNA polymerase sigma factor [Chloroflexi bacterium]|nr:sigma-70 family RNA polymerase sigma factor [Chloroflexota bacterium]